MKWLSYAQFTNGRLGDSSVYHAGKMGLVRAASEPKKILNWARNGIVMTDLPKGGCVTPVCIMWERMDQSRLHLNQKDLNSGKK